MKAGFADLRKTKIKIATNVNGAEKRINEITKLFQKREGVSTSELKDIFGDVKSKIEDIKKNFNKIKSLYKLIPHPITGRESYVDLNTLHNILNEIILNLEKFANMEDTFLEKIKFNNYVEETVSELKETYEYVKAEQSK